MGTPTTIRDLIGAGAALGASALGAPGRSDLSYAQLTRLIEETRARLRRVGGGPTSRVALVLPNGPELAAAVLAVAAGAAAAPLNPAYRRAEFEFFLDDLEADALIVEQGSTSPAIDAARARGMTVLELRAMSAAPAGAFTLEGATPEPAGATAEPTGEDIALLLHTSGTTARPKLVPLRQKNLTASARHIAATLRLTPEDRCLNIMPLFHIHGLIGALLASLAAGASVSCAPGFNALKFFSWLEAVRPSWYSAVPTMHQAILARAQRNRPSGEGLRLVRSSSASLAPATLADLEALFACPVIESYGMTEAAHQMTSNPLPPGRRKPGSVGLPAGPEVAIMDDANRLLEPGAIGEVVIRGPNVMTGYARNPEANAEAFTHGWFRTGDQGAFDADGCLTLTGRLKEIINRGGEKIAPKEVDEILAGHPAVAQAVAFAVPHPKLGQDIAAAVVLRKRGSADERALRDFAAERLAAFKVPRRILILERLPTGATGKVQRAALAKTLGLDG
ncbi:MAG: AMP-binding protein [Alphaproteobacteria bacterium]